MTSTIGITLGDPAGIGPEIALLAAIELTEKQKRDVKLVFIGNEKSLEITAKALRACGCDDPEDLEGDPTCVGRNVVELDVQSELYQGKPSLRVKWINTPRRFVFKQALDAGSKANALSRLKGYAVRDAQANGAVTSAQPRIDDIPF